MNEPSGRGSRDRRLRVGHPDAAAIDGARLCKHRGGAEARSWQVTACGPRHSIAICSIVKGGPLPVAVGIPMKLDYAIGRDNLVRIIRSLGGGL